MMESLIMTNIDINKLEQFKLNYDADISNSLDYLRIINQELSNMKEYIDTPIIGKRIDEFSSEYNNLANNIKEVSKLMSDYLASIIKVYQSLGDVLQRGVGNEEL